MEFILEQLARSEAAHVKWEEHVAQHDREIGAIRKNLARAVKLSVLEARHERKRRQELDEKITQLAAAQLLTEQELRKFIRATLRGKNGHS
jgi:hypothetical protein